MMKYMVKENVYGAHGAVVFAKGEIVDGKEGKDAQLFEPLSFEVSTPSEEDKPKRGRQVKEVE